MRRISIATPIITIAKTALTPTNKILKYAITKAEIEEETLRDQEATKALIEITHNNTLKINGMS